MRWGWVALALLAAAAGGGGAATGAPAVVTGLLWIPGLERTGAAFRRALVELAARLGVDPNHLAAAMAFESGFSPTARNPKSGAIGLIQFTKGDAEALGTTREALAQMTDVEQLGYVEKHFRGVMGRRHLTRLEDVYLAIFAPARIGLPYGATVYAKPSRSYYDNDKLDRDGDGIITVAEATGPVRGLYAEGQRRGPLPPAQQPAGPPAAQPGPVPGVSLQQLEVTPEMTAWALEVLHGPLPIGATTGPRSFVGKDGAPLEVIARVESHPPTSSVPRVHRGVGLYHVPGVMPAGGGKPTVPGSSADVYRSQKLILHPAGFVALPSGVEITRLPLLDENGLYGHVGAATAAELLAAMHLRLPTAAEYLALHALSLFIGPTVLPTGAMLVADGVPKPWFDSKGQDTPQMAAYRAAHMSTRAWCELHDGAVNAKLAAAAWAGQPVANAGKHWCSDGAIIGWWKQEGGQIQGLSYFHEPNDKPHTPPLGQHADYATTVHAVRGVIA